MAIADWLNGISAGGSVLGGIGSTVGGLLNFGAQSDNLRWQKQAQKEAWNREDTAVQRRARDLEAAGLSKTLAAGSAATTMAPIRTEAPQIDTTAATAGFKGISEAAQNFLAMTAQKAQIDKTVEENKLLRLQQNKQELENAFMTQANPLNLQGIQQEIDFSRLANPARLEKLNQENTSLGISNRNAQLDTKLKTLGISQAEVDLIGSKITNESKTLGLTIQQKEVLAKQLAIEKAQLDLDNNRWNTKWYHDVNLPNDYNMGPFGSPVLGGLSGLDSMFKGLSDVGNRLFNGKGK